MKEKKYYGTPDNANKFIAGKDKVYYAKAMYGDEEIEAVVACLKKGGLGSGELTKQFEKKIADLFGQKYGLSVNSGSSGIFLALKAAEFPEGAEVITPACTFSTTFSSIILNNYVPVVGDSVIGSYNLDLNNLEKLVSPKTKAILAPHVLGNIQDMQRLSSFCKRNNLLFIEDSCDTIGGSFDGKYTGTYSDVAISSFSAPHIITAGGGSGVITTSNEALKKNAYAYRENGKAIEIESEEIADRFTDEFTDVLYDKKFTYTQLGFNLRPVEMMFAFGLEQLKRLSEFIEIRKRNFNELYNFFKEYQDYFILPEVHPKADPVWLAFPLTIAEGAPFSRFDVIQFLEEKNIQTRMLLAGNILRHPGYKKIYYRTIGNLENADRIMKDSFVIGCHQGITSEMVDYVKNTFYDFLKKF